MQGSLTMDSSLREKEAFKPPPKAQAHIIVQATRTAKKFAGWRAVQAACQTRARVHRRGKLPRSSNSQVKVQGERRSGRAVTRAPATTSSSVSSNFIVRAMRHVPLSPEASE